MKAAIGSPEGLQVRDVPKPAVKPTDLLVRVSAAGLNRADLGAARATTHASHGTPGNPIGLEWAGEVAEVGSEVREFKPGDRVMCNGIGGYAEYAATDAGRTMPMPANLSFEQAAVLPTALLTLHDALVTNGRLKEGDIVFIQGASSGVGLMGLQIAWLKGASMVIGSSTNDERRARLKDFGADVAIDPREADLSEQLLKATDGKGVDLTVDMVSGAAVSQIMKGTALRGRIVNVGRLGGAKAEFDFDQHALKRIAYIGVTFRTRTVEEIREIVRRMRADLWDAVSAGKLALPIDRTFGLDEAPAAQAHMRANAHFGKIVLRI